MRLPVRWRWELLSLTVILLTGLVLHLIIGVVL